MNAFEEKVKRLFDQYEELITRKNEPVEHTNGVYTRCLLYTSDAADE